MNVERQFSDFMMSKHYSKSTIDSYMSCLRLFMSAYGERLHRVPIKDIRSYLSDKSYALIKQNVGMMRILYHNILGQKKKSISITYPRKPKMLPIVYSREEVQRMIDSIENIKHMAIIELIYSSGLRISEVTTLRPHDIDSDRMQVYIKGGKGMKDRYTCLSRKNLETLRKYYLTCRPDNYLFEGTNGLYSSTSIRKIFERAKERCGIRKGTVHTLRHSFATHAIESGIPTIILQRWLGHNSSKTTEIYTQLVSTAEFESPY